MSGAMTLTHEIQYGFWFYLVASPSEPQMDLKVQTVLKKSSSRESNTQIVNDKYFSPREVNFNL